MKRQVIKPQSHNLAEVNTIVEDKPAVIEPAVTIYRRMDPAVAARTKTVLEYPAN